MKKKDKAMLIMRFLLIFCWSFVGHRILNKYAFDQLLRPTARNKFLETTKRRDLMVHAEDSTKCDAITPDVWCTADKRDKRLGFTHGAHSVTSTEGMHNRGKHYFDLAKTYWDRGDFDRSAYAVGYALHYAQDALCPVHITKVSDSEHATYEASGSHTCSSHGTCVGYNEVVNSGYINNIDALIKSTNYDNKTGQAILIDPTVRRYIGETRLNHWKNATNATQRKQNYLWDLAYAMNILKRYVKNSTFFS